MPYVSRDRTRYEPSNTDRKIGKVAREMAKACRWCDGTSDYRVQCGNETAWACVGHVDHVEKMVRSRHPMKYPVLLARIV